MSVPGAARATVSALLCICTVVGVSAQADLPPLPSTPIEASLVVPVLTASLPARLSDLEQWVHEYEAWKVWFARWHNRREPGWLWTRERRPRPDPPAWLPGSCALLLEDRGPLAEGCRLWREWKQDDYPALLRAAEIAQARADLENPRNSIWWERIHLDALWPMAQAGSSAFGVFGVHVTLDVTSRIQVFLAPGAILMRVPTGRGTHAWTPATDWGFSYRMFDFRLPGRGPSTLHLNLARVWLLGAAGDLPVSRDLYLAGFSLTFKRSGAARP